MVARRLTSIDALRGFAALVVVLAHVVERASFVGMASAPEWVGLALDRAFSYGRVGVTLFFAISGFCIHLRWARARSEGGDARLHFTSFWKQRFIRLYPPFLAALGLYLAVQTWDGSIRWGSFAAYNLISHLLMFHNFDERTIFSIDGVFWTLAIEEQLYLAYFLLLPLRERRGWRTTLMACLVARVAWFALAFLVNNLAGGGYRLPHEGGSLAHWFVWALGAVAIEAALGLIRLPDWASQTRTALACFAAAIACDLVSEFHLLGGLGWRLTWLVAEPLWGVGLFVVINRLVAAEARWRSACVMPRPVTWFAALGLFSYSTYLMHHLVLLYLDPVLFRAFGMPPSLGNKLLSLPLCLAISWAFFVLVERPCIAGKAPRSPGRPGAPGRFARPPLALESILNGSSDQ